MTSGTLSFSRGQETFLLGLLGILEKDHFGQFLFKA
jgi:hypothetical protein